MWQAIALAAALLPGAQVDEPRAFGHVLGDRVQRVVRLQVPEGFTLDRDSLPRAGRRGQALELQRVDLDAHTLTLHYQVMASPVEPRVLELPPFTLRFAGRHGSATESLVRVDAWPLAVSPLAPLEASPRHGLGELRPDTAPPPVDTAAIRTRLAVEAALLAALLLYLLHVYVGLPWWARRHRPFGQAWRGLRRLGPLQRRTAFEQLHAAFNRSAGEALFASGLDRFVAARPRFAPLRAEMAEFFRRSDREFFDSGAPSAAPDEDLRWLQQFARDCRDAERGTA